MRDYIERFKAFILHGHTQTNSILYIALFLFSVVLLVTEILLRKQAREPVGRTEHLNSKIGSGDYKKPPTANTQAEPEPTEETETTKTIPDWLDFFNTIKNTTQWMKCSLWFGIFIFIVLVVIWLFINKNTWIVLPFEMGQTESEKLDGEKVATQLIAELSRVGAGNPVPALTYLEPQEPHTKSGNVLSLIRLPLEECGTVLQGPGNYNQSWSIPLLTVQAGSEDNLLDLGNLTIGTINIPTRLFLQFILRILPNSYREFNGQINEANGELEISVTSSNSPKTWSVTGPTEAYSAMMEYLAVRITLDLNPDVVKNSGLPVSPLDRDLAFAMGTKAFRAQHYHRASAFYEIAERFAPLDNEIDAMLGLTYYQQALNQPDRKSTRLHSALRAVEAAVQEDPASDRSSLRPYLVCLLNETGLEEQRDTHLVILNEYLRQRGILNKEERVAELNKIQKRGVGWHISAVDNIVMYLDGSGVIRDSSNLTNTISGSPDDRQIRFFEHPKGFKLLFVVTEDGAVKYRILGGSPEFESLISGTAVGGVQQMDISYSNNFERTNLILLDRYGRLHWCDLKIGNGSENIKCERLKKNLISDQKLIPQEVNTTGTLSDFQGKAITARQFVQLEDKLYILTGDGTVWVTKIGELGYTSAPLQLPATNDVHEIFVADNDILFLLDNNGNVSRIDETKPESESLSEIDQGTTTAHIFEAGGYLYMLKKNGAVWRVRNPQNPDPENDFSKIYTPLGRINLPRDICL